MLDAALKLGSQINREWRLRQKWLFSVASIILNALIHEAHDLAGEPQERRAGRSQQKLKAVRPLDSARTR
jgi:hypothetical protein